MDIKFYRFFCNNINCNYDVISYYGDPMLDTDCPKCRWHDSVIEDDQPPIKRLYEKAEGYEQLLEAIHKQIEDME